MNSKDAFFHVVADHNPDQRRDDAAPVRRRVDIQPGDGVFDFPHRSYLEIALPACRARILRFVLMCRTHDLTMPRQRTGVLYIEDMTSPRRADPRTIPCGAAAVYMPRRSRVPPQPARRPILLTREISRLGPGMPSAVMNVCPSAKGGRQSVRGRTTGHYGQKADRSPPASRVDPPRRRNILDHADTEQVIDHLSVDI
jgi:hypothetical protein